MSGRWTMSERTGAELAEKMQQAILDGLTDRSSIAEVIDHLGSGGLASLLSGTTDKGSRAYKSAQRNVQRWSRGRNPAARTREKVSQALRQRAADRARQQGRVGYSMGGAWTTSKHTWEGKAHGTLSGDALTEWINAVSAGDWETAAEVQAGEYFGDPDIVAGLDDLGDIQID